MYSDPFHVLFIRTNQWMQAIELQVNRVLGLTLDPIKDGESKYRNQWNQKQRDIDYFVIAINRLRVAVQSTNTIIKSKELEKAISAFNKSIPDIQILRNISEHFDEYDWGKGFAEKELNSESPTYSWGQVDGGITYRGKKLTLIQSRKAARELHKGVMNFLKINGKEINLNEWPLVQA